MAPIRFYLVGRERVTIIKTYTHTYHVRFVKSGKVLEIHKSYLRTWTPKPKKSNSKPKTQKKDSSDKKGDSSSQLNFNF